MSKSVVSIMHYTHYPGCEGFDYEAGKHWIYPNNMAIRSYQKQAVQLALFHNSMIVLPTGFGKTFIAAVVMFNFYRWYPKGKIIFVAPTRPLVAQQISECKKISGMPSNDCIELTGSTPQERRHTHWHSKRVFFATPQVIQNDLQNELIEPKLIKCIVIDEAHKAQGGYAYVEIVKYLQCHNCDGFRVLALSATPGSNIDRVRQVMINLFVDEVMFRREDSLDLINYKNTKNSKAWIVRLTGKHKQIIEKFDEITKPIFKELNRAGLIFSCDTIQKCSRYVLLMAKDRLRRNQVQNVSGGRKGKLMFYLSSAISLVNTFEFLAIYGIRLFYASIKKGFEEGGPLKNALVGNPAQATIMKDIQAMFGEDIDIDPNQVAKHDLTISHPKLVAVRDLLTKHFDAHKNVVENDNQQSDQTPPAHETKAIVFTKYRDSVLDIVQTLRSLEPTIRPCPFVGQGSGAAKGKGAGKGTGMTQREQIATIREFKEGKYNVLVATCVAEEGLDIGEVDLIICYDTSVSPISNTQRRGRTGRKRAGDVQTLVTEGFEEKKLSQAGNSRRTVEDQLYKRENYMMSRYRHAPRMVPPGIMPQCMEKEIICPIEEDQDQVASRGRKKSAAPKRKKRKDDNDDEDEMFIRKDKCSKKTKYLDEDWDDDFFDDDDFSADDDDEFESARDSSTTKKRSSSARKCKQAKPKSDYNKIFSDDEEEDIDTFAQLEKSRASMDFLPAEVTLIDDESNDNNDDNNNNNDDDTHDYVIPSPSISDVNPRSSSSLSNNKSSQATTTTNLDITLTSNSCANSQTNNIVLHVDDDDSLQWDDDWLK